MDNDGSCKMSVSITVKDKDFNRQVEKLLKSHKQKLYYTVVDSTNKMHKLAVHNAPVDNGVLRREIKHEISSLKEITGIVTSHAAYSQAVEEGTRPHKIEVKDKKVLAGKGTGKGGWNVYGTKVQHPGTKPRPFLYPAFTVAKNYLYKQIERLF